MQEKKLPTTGDNSDKSQKQNWFRKLGNKAVHGLAKVVGQGAEESVLGDLAGDLLEKASKSAVEYVRPDVVAPPVAAPSPGQIVNSSDSAVVAPSSAQVVKTSVRVVESSDPATTVPLPAKEGTAANWMATGAIQAAKSPLASQLAIEAMAVIKKNQNLVTPVNAVSADEVSQENGEESSSEEASDEGLAATLGDIFGSPTAKVVFNAGVQAIQQHLQPSRALTQPVADKAEAKVGAVSGEEDSNEEASGDDLATTLGDVFGSPTGKAAVAAVQAVASPKNRSGEGDESKAVLKKGSTLSQLFNSAQQSELVGDLAKTVVQRGVDAVAKKQKSSAQPTEAHAGDGAKKVVIQAGSSAERVSDVVPASNHTTATGVSLSTQAIAYGACAGATLWLLPKVAKPLLNVVMNETAAEIVSTGVSWCAFFAGSYGVRNAVGFYNKAEAKQLEHAESSMKSAPAASMSTK